MYIQKLYTSKIVPFLAHPVYDVEDIVCLLLQLETVDLLTLLNACHRCRRLFFSCHLIIGYDGR